MEQQGKTENNGNSRLETGNIWKLMLSLSIPSIIAQLVGILYNMVDRMYRKWHNGHGGLKRVPSADHLYHCVHKISGDRRRALMRH